MTSTHVTITHDNPAIIHLKNAIEEYAKLATSEEGILQAAFRRTKPGPLQTFINNARVSISTSKTNYRSRLKRIGELAALTNTHDTYAEFGRHVVELSRHIYHKIAAGREESVDANWLAGRKVPVEVKFSNGLSEFDRILNGMLQAQKAHVERMRKEAEEAGEQVTHTLHVSIRETDLTFEELQRRLEHYATQGTKR